MNAITLEQRAAHIETLQSMLGQDYPGSAPDCLPQFSAEREALTAAIEALRLSAGADWQPVESAPRDGTWILLTDANYVHMYLIARWHKPTKAWWGQLTRSGHSIVWNEATHWQPLPAAPRHEPGEGIRAGISQLC